MNCVDGARQVYGVEALNNSIEGLQNGTLGGPAGTKMVPWKVHFGENGTLSGPADAKWYPKKSAFGSKMVPWPVHPDDIVDASMTYYRNEIA